MYQRVSIPLLPLTPAPRRLPLPQKKTADTPWFNSYIENAIWKLKYLIQNNGTTTTTELNEIAYTHLLQLGEDYTHNFDYCGVVINEGALRIVFKPGALGTNVSCALDPLIDALNDAPHPDKKPLNVKARLNIEQKYVPEIEELTEKFKKMLNVGMFTLTPNFEDNFAVLANSEHACDDWQQNMGSFTKAYFEGAHYQMDYKKFGEDDMLQEGFNEEVGKHEIALRVVDKLKKGSGYSEIFIEEGVLIVQTTPENFGTNVSYVCEGILDLL